MPDRDLILDSLKSKMEEAGFLFEKKQKPFMQPKRGWELKFIHPELVKKLRQKYPVRGKNFYIKQLSDTDKSKIGLVNGKLTDLNKAFESSPSNSKDTFDKSPAWVNKTDNQALDKLLTSIKKYLNNKGNT